MVLRKKKYKVVVIDDALLMRNVLSDILNLSGRFEVVGTAGEGRSGIREIQKHKPDLVTCDVEMPIMDGIETVKEIMKVQPTPVIMVSSITYEGGFKTIEALDNGAFDFIQKPKAQFSASLNQVAKDIIAKALLAVESGYIKKYQSKSVASAIKSNTKFTNNAAKESEPQKHSLLNVSPKKLLRKGNLKDYVIAIGISTGGPPCITEIFKNLPKNSPPVLVVQHMPEAFTKAFAERINKVSEMEVCEAQNNDKIEMGKGYIAPGHSHMEVNKNLKGELIIRLNKKPNVSGHRPSVDVLFKSVANICREKAIGVIMTGMGRDGATELNKLNKIGAHTIAQDEESSVVFGMPKAAIIENSVDEILSLQDIVLRLKSIASKK